MSYHSTLTARYEIPEDVPKLKRSPNIRYIIPSSLQLSDDIREQLQAHMDSVNVDKHRFEHSIEDQSQDDISM